ncbi:MAG TPA: rod shape-determining protein MreC [Candidatus Limnocylindrales bacterium]|nr:rod shape-determining protein MreC [Candidatus Limnocylindrales bacterium]
MLTGRPARRQAILYVVLLAAAILMLAFSSSGPLVELRSGIGFAMSPIQNVLRQGARTVGSLFATVGEIDRLRQANDELTQRLNELEAANRSLESVRIQNEQLTELMQVRSALDYETVAGEVISRRTTPQERVISIGTGSEAGITVDDPVVAGGGALVGQVVEVGRGYSRILLISDMNFFVAGLTEISRGIGDVQGQAERPLSMTRIPATDAITVGESVVTAGIELAEGVRSPYPKGLLIGTIVNVERSPDQLFQTALVQPAAPLERLEYVLVITNYEGGLPDASPDPSLLPEESATPNPT